jgi:hypothetical protein
MLVLFALGVMSLFWTALVAAVILVQKLLPRPEQAITPVLATLLVGLGIWVALAPGSVPGLTQPDSPGADHARLRLMHMPVAFPTRGVGLVGGAAKTGLISKPHET